MQPHLKRGIIVTMKTISLAVSEPEYEAYRSIAQQEGRPIAQLIREAMAVYRAEHLEQRQPLLEFPVLLGHRLITDPPQREDLWDDILAEEAL